MSSPSPEFSAASLSTLERPDDQSWQVILKLAGECNLRCKDCYVYDMADQSWKNMPALMPEATEALVAARIAEHHQEDPETKLGITLHGGEPLLVGPRRLAATLATLKEAAPEAVSFTIHTNATLLTHATLKVLDEFGVAVGVSLDGGKEANDRHRLFRGGRSSYAPALRGIQLLREEYSHLYAGILAVIDLCNEPEPTYEELAALTPPTLDFLLPHGNWDNPPPGKQNVLHTPYSDWLIRVFNLWHQQPFAERPNVRTFQSIMRQVLGKGSVVESIGSPPVREFTIQPDGSYEQVDTLQSTYEGAARLGMDVVRHTFQEVMDHPAIRLRTLGAAALSETLSPTCQKCPLPIKRVCEGGLLAHRYGSNQPDKPFNHPSVYCYDLTELITEIGSAMRVDQLRELARQNAGDLNRLLRGGEAF